MIRLFYKSDYFDKNGNLKTSVKPLDVTFNNIDEMFKTYKNIRLQKNENVFYTIANHKTDIPTRNKKTWLFQDVVPFDLDGIDLDRINEYPRLACEAIGVEVEKCAVIYTGNGIHILVKVERITSIDYFKKNKAGYRALYDKIVKACEKNGLPITPDYTSFEPSRILRFPGTVNIKHKEVTTEENGELVKKLVEVKKHCKLICSKLEIQKLDFPKVGDVEESLKPGSFPKPDENYILEQCEFFKWLKECPGEVHEPHAYAMLSITGHFETQDISKEYWSKFSTPSINSKDLGEFTEQALTASGPRTCEGINETWGNCRKCPHYGRVKSPILLKSKSFIGTEHLGFTILTKNGGQIRQYDDLRLFFDRKYKYKVTETGIIYVFNGKFYERFSDSRVKQFANEHFSAPVKEVERSEFLANIKSHNIVSDKWAVGIIEGLINFNNGILDIKTGDLLEHSHEYNFFSVLPYDYDEQATAPIFENFLDEITLGREDLKNILLEFMGYSVSGMEYIYNKALILSGSGKNGKSTFVNILRELVGVDNTSSISMTRASTNEYLGAELQHKLINISEEEGANVFKDTGFFKIATGNTIFQVRKIYERPFTMVNRAKIILTYNEMPYVGETSNGIRRRLMIVPFELNLINKPTDHKLLDKLKKELPGIFNLALKGLNRLLEQDGFTHSDIVTQQAIETIEASSNVVAWFKDRVTITDCEDDRISTTEFFNNYKEYVDSNKEGYPVSRRKFCSTLKNYFINNSLRCEYGKMRINGKPKNGFSFVKLDKSDLYNNF